MTLRMMLVVSTMALIVGCASEPEATYQKLTMEQTPIAVRRGIERAYPDAKVKNIERETYKDTKVVHYEVELITAKGREVEFELAEDGEMLEKD